MVKIRQAELKDVNDIYNILNPYVITKTVLERTHDDIKRNLKEFYIAEDNSKIIGTISYHDYGNKLFEIRSLAVNKSFSGHGTGRKLVETIIEFLKKIDHNSKIFTLTYVPDFFKKLNFKIVSKDTFPEKIWKDCSKCLEKNSCGETALVYNV